MLTGIRLLLVPVFLAALLVDDGTDTGWRLVAFAVFVVAALTDRLDGELARRRGLVTAFGTMMDPIADKALTGLGADRAVAARPGARGGSPC